MPPALEAVPAVGSLGEVSLAEVLGELRVRRFTGSLVLTELGDKEHTIVFSGGEATKVKTSVEPPAVAAPEGENADAVESPEDRPRRALLALVATVDDRAEYVQYADLDLLGSASGVATGRVASERLLWAAVRGRASTPDVLRRIAYFRKRPLHVDPEIDLSRWHMGKPGRALVDALRERPMPIEELDARSELAGKKVGPMVLALSIGGAVATEAGAFRRPAHPQAAAIQEWIRTVIDAPQSVPVEEPPPAERTPKHLYLAFSLALVPLLATVGDRTDDVQQRVQHTMATHPELGSLWETGTKDQILAALPEHQLEGAWLPSHTFAHWGYAVASALVLVGAAWFLFERGHARIKHLARTTLFTATCGIALLLLFQAVASFTQGFWIRGGNIVVLLFYVVKFIGFSYSAAMDPENGFVLSMLGFTFGVGLCEELTKALPLLWHYRRSRRLRPQLDWRGARLWMVASGIGFGVAEGVMYSSDYYNGIHSAGIYVVRFVSCVALHAVWSASVGIAIYLRRLELEPRGRHWADVAVSLVRTLFVPMVLHGLYDTLLKKGMSVLALAVAAASFGWLVWQVEKARAAERGSVTAAVPAGGSSALN